LTQLLVSVIIDRKTAQYDRDSAARGNFLAVKTKINTAQAVRR